jgi:diacylglycerol kinase family enzyme
MPTAATMTSGKRNGALAKRRTALVLVNRQAGAVLERGDDAFRHELRQLFSSNGIDATVESVDPDTLVASFATAQAESSVDMIILAGGDGTVNAALPHMRADGPAVAVLPLGTYNLIGRDLGAPRDIAAAVVAIAGGRPASVDLGQVNDRLFHSKVGLGWFVKVAQERQAARQHFPFSRLAGTLFAITKALVYSRSIRVSYAVGGVRGETTAVAVLVTNNRFDPASIARPALDDGMLELHVVHAPTFISRLRTLAAVARGKWRELPNVESIVTPEAAISIRGDRARRVAVDGELMRMTFPLMFSIRPRAVRMIVADQASGPT